MKEWTQEQPDIVEDGMISADAISDLRTDENCISTWYVGEKGAEDIKKGVLALASGFRSLEEIRIVFLDDRKLCEAGLDIKETDGYTKIEEYKTLHRDIASLNAGKLQKLAKIVLESVWAEDTETIHKDTIVGWMLDALNRRQLIFNSLDKNMRRGFAASVKKMVNTKKVHKDSIREEVWKAIEQQLEANTRKTTCKFEGECERYRKKA